MKVRPCLIVQLPDYNLQREEAGGETVQHKPETVQVDKAAISVRTISGGRGPGRNGNSSRRYAFPSVQSAGGGSGEPGKTHAEVNTGGRWMDSAKLCTPKWSFMDHHQCVHLKTLGMETTKGDGRERKKTVGGEGKGGSGTNQQPRSKGRGGRRDALQLSRTRWKK